ncbi:hypothetical protein HK405_015235, partial [Cladochytrium tenue]
RRDDVVNGSLPFTFDLERVIDDFVLLSFFVGNDFLPHLPGLHINDGALARFFSIYKEALPSLGGYVNDAGRLHLGRVEALLKEIGKAEFDAFMADRADLRYVEGKRAESQEQQSQRKGRRTPQRRGGGPQNASDGVPKTTKLGHYDRIKAFVNNRTAEEDSTAPILSFSSSLPARERAFVAGIARELGIRCSGDGGGGGPPLTDNDDNEGDANDSSGSGGAGDGRGLVLWWDTDDDASDEESSEARQRVFRRYDGAAVHDEAEISRLADERAAKSLEEEFVESKRDYYKNKLEIDYNNETQLSKIVFHYVEGLQWVLYYYYQGVPSWEWFYPYHYAPKITDLVNLQRFDPITFELGRPFLPFYQLMGVLPSASKELIPAAFRDLMTDIGSPIIDFYPREFGLDMNEKKQDWEAIVLIPFIDEKRLIAALE